MGFNWSLRFEMILHVFARLFTSRRWKRIYRKFRTCFECHYIHLLSFKQSQSQFSFFHSSFIWIEVFKNFPFFHSRSTADGKKFSDQTGRNNIEKSECIVWSRYWMSCDLRWIEKHWQNGQTLHVQCQLVFFVVFTSDSPLVSYSILLWIYIQIQT